MPTRSHRERFGKSVERLAGELSLLLQEQAGLEALLESQTPAFVQLCIIALLGDRLARLIRILEVSRRNEVSSFWYLVHCEPKRVRLSSDDKSHLEHLATRLKPIRDQTFFHIDKNGVLDGDAIYAAAGITGGEIIKAIEIMWGILKVLYVEEFADRSVPSWLAHTRSGLREAFARDLTAMGLKRSHENARG